MATEFDESKEMTVGDKFDQILTQAPDNHFRKSLFVYGIERAQTRIIDLDATYDGWMRCFLEDLQDPTQQPAGGLPDRYEIIASTIADGINRRILYNRQQEILERLD